VKRTLRIYCFGIVCQAEADTIKPRGPWLPYCHFKMTASDYCSHTPNPYPLAHENRRLMLGAKRLEPAYNTKKFRVNISKFQFGIDDHFSLQHAGENTRLNDMLEALL